MLAVFIPKLPDLLPRPGAWHPFPTSNERSGWNSLPVEVRQDLVQRGEASLGYTWPGLPASLFLEYARMGNRSNYEKIHFERRHRVAELVLAECVEGMGRFLEDIANGVWAICEETYWGVPAHVGVQKAGVGLPDAGEPTVDLFVGETVALLAWVETLLGARLDIISPRLKERIRLEAKRRVLDPCLERDDFWWMSFDPGEHSINNWNPWVNSNWLVAVLLLESDRQRQVAAVSKILRSLDLFIDMYGEAGGCDEGPGYWGRAAASLFDCLELLFGATEGKLSVYDQVKIQNMGRFIYRTHIGEDYYVNFADASAVNQPSAGLVFRYGQRIGDSSMMGFGAWLAERAGPAVWAQRDSLTRWLPALYNLAAIQATAPIQPLPQAFWFEDIQVLVARESPGSTAGLFLAAKGGHNAESHNHNDIGSFIVYADGLPLVVDAGVETYTRKTFSPQRYEIWTMQSAYHNLLPAVRNTTGVWQQAPGRQFAAQDVASSLEQDAAHLSLDLAGAYPPEAGLQHWLRSIRLAPGGGVTLQDEFEFSHPVQELQLSLLTPAAPEMVKPGVLDLRSKSFGAGRVSSSGEVRYPAEIFEVTFEDITIRDERLGSVWGEALTRMVFRSVAPVQQGRWDFRFTLPGPV